MPGGGNNNQNNQQNWNNQNNQNNWNNQNNNRNNNNFGQGPPGAGRARNNNNYSHDNQAFQNNNFDPNKRESDNSSSNKSNIRMSTLPDDMKKDAVQNSKFAKLKYKYTKEIRLGETVRLRRGIKGVVKWIDPLCTTGNPVLGIKYKRSWGDSDGTYKGTRYFAADTDCAQFLASNQVTHVIRENDQSGKLEKIRYQSLGNGAVQRVQPPEPAAQRQQRRSIAQENVKVRDRQKLRVQQLLKSKKKIQDL
eukprot:UN24737